MKHSYQLSCESTVDMPYGYISGREVSVLFYTYSIDGKEYEDNMGRDEAVMADFFAQLKSGKLPITSQINQFRYEEYFEELLQKGDVLHIAFGTGMTPSYHNAVEAAKLLQEQKVSVKVLRTNDRWFGLTYKEDAASVKESFRQLIADGVYGEQLFEDLKY